MSQRDLEALRWPAGRLQEAMALVAREHRFGTLNIVSSGSVNVEEAAESVGIEAEKLRLTYRDVDDVLATSAPLVIRVAPDADAFFVLLRNRGAMGTFAASDGATIVLRRNIFTTMLRQAVEDSHGEALDRLLLKMHPQRKADLRRRLIAERFGDEEVGECWLLRRSPHQDFRRHLGDAGIGTSAAALCVTHFLRYLVFILAWTVIGRTAISGQPDDAWLLAWMLLLLMLVPIHSVAATMQGRIAVGCGFVLRHRLLYGSLRIDPDQLRSDGIGRHLSRVFESEAIESLGRSGGFLAFFALIELAMAAFVLAAGAGGTLHVVLLGGWIACVVAIAFVFARRYEGWTAERLSLTSDLVERMVGHRTRLVQQPSDSWHEEEDGSLESYAHASRQLDDSLTRVTALIPRGWIGLALLGLAPALVAGRASAGAMAISLGGIILAQQAMKRIATGLPDLIGAVSAWKKISPLLQAASQTPSHPSLAGAAAMRNSRNLIEAQDVVFRHRDRSEPVLRGCTFRIRDGERVVLEGGSGSGKSTLASLLAGGRSPDAGLLLLGGFDRATLGTREWRRHVVLAPQFHENHVLSESLAFNLLMGRQWPPSSDDWREAETVCIELGLGPLLERMPGGLGQMVGETGWRLSHGEQSRLFIARALLQKARLVILDESFAALDPETLKQSIDCVVRRAPAVVVIAHP